MLELDGNKTEWINGTAKLNGQKDYYMDREDIVKKKGNERYCITKLRPRTKLTLSGNLTMKYKKMINPG
jgi:hypothetical protein